MKELNANKDGKSLVHFPMGMKFQDIFLAVDDFLTNFSIAHRVGGSPTGSVAWPVFKTIEIFRV